MGNCVDQEAPLLISSKKIEEIAQENLTLLSGLIRFCIEEKEYGAAVKLMKIKDRTGEHYSINTLDRKRLQEIEERLEETDRRELQAQLAEELLQVKRANRVLEAYFKQLKHLSWFSSSKKTQEYISEFDWNPRNRETYKYLEREYLNNKITDGHFEEFVLKINFGEDIPDQYALNIRHICDHTTYVFLDQSKRVCYTPYFLNPRYSKQLSRQISK